MDSNRMNEVTQAHPGNGSLMKSFDHTYTYTFNRVHVDSFARMSYQRISCPPNRSHFTLTPSSLRLSFLCISIVRHSRQNTAAVKVYAYVRHRHLDTYTFLWIIRWKNAITITKHNKWSCFILWKPREEETEDHYSSYSLFHSLLSSFRWHASNARILRILLLYSLYLYNDHQRGSDNIHHHDGKFFQRQMKWKKNFFFVCGTWKILFVSLQIKLNAYVCRAPFHFYFLNIRSSPYPLIPNSI